MEVLTHRFCGHSKSDKRAYIPKERDDYWHVHDCINSVAKQLSDHEYILSARLEISKINELFDLELPESDEYMTLGGLILHVYQSFPKLNEVVKFENYEFKIVKNTATKIELVRLSIK